MRAFIPAGTEIVTIQNGSPIWYTTKTEINVNGYVTGLCPLRNALPVLTAIVAGRPVWFLENQVNIELTEEQKTFVQMHKFVKVEYDIPARVSTRPQDYRDENGNSFVHPSQWLWGYACRTTLSCWLMTEEKYKAVQFRLRRLTRAGCQWEPTWIDSSNAARHLQKAIVSLRKAWVEADASYDDCLKRAEEAFTNGNRSNEEERKLRYAKNRIDKALDTARENITQAANLYGIPMDWITTGKAVTQATVVNGEVAPKIAAPTTSAVRNANRADAKTKNEAFCKTVEALKAHGTDESKAMAKSMEKGEVAEDIVADYCEQNEIETDEDGTFSLRDVFKD